jgi:hypothetical protein
MPTPRLASAVSMRTNVETTTARPRKGESKRQISIGDNGAAGLVASVTVGSDTWVYSIEAANHGELYGMKRIA